MLEIRRRVVHISVGLVIIAALSFWGAESYEYIEGALLALFIVGLWIIDMKLKKRKLPVIDYMLGVFERPHALPAYGAFWYGMGVLLLVSFSGNISYTKAGIAILALGDGVATLVGRSGRMRIPYNRNKTLEGSAAFFVVSCFASYPFIGASGIPLSFLCAVAESIDWGVDDNFIVPLSILAFHSLGFG